MKTNQVVYFFFTICLIFYFGIGCDSDAKNQIEETEFVQIDFYKFSDFGCEDIPWRFNYSEISNETFILRSQEEFEKYLISECIPQIDFSKYIIIIGNKSFNTGAKLFSEKVEENNLRIIYTVTFQEFFTLSPEDVNFYVIIEKSLDTKKIEIIEKIK